MSYRPFGVFRTVLAILVLLQHIGHVGPVSMTWLGRLGAGPVAVLMFFCLSGFVITEAAERFYRDRPVRFALNRILRIMPQYVLSLVSSAIVIAIAAAATQNFLPNALVPYAERDLFTFNNILANILMVIPGFASNNPPFVPYVWALRVETLFYVIVFLALFAPKNGWHIARALLIVSAAAMYGAALNRIGPDLFQFVPYFALGGVTYGVMRDPSRTGYGLVASLFALCLWTCATMSMPSFFVGKTNSTENLALQLGLFAVLGLVFLILAHVRAPARWNRIDRRIGDLSFPFYLQQYAVLVFVLAFLPVSYASVVFCAVLTLVWAWCSDAIAEAPIRALRDRIRGRSVHSRGTASPNGAVSPEILPPSRDRSRQATVAIAESRAR